ncbi:MAG: hypothetical protein LBD48_05975 [Treponema sp.]|jgi:hypothetical protein|nr:hypothetical protein [Treponema sp.]
MEAYRPLRAGLFIYESVRLGFLAGTFTILRPDGGAAFFPWLACMSSNALFPLMTLFLLLDISRYGAYAPLYMAGKCVSFFSVMGWCVFFRRNIINAAFLDEAVLFIAPGILAILLFGDLLSASAGFIVVKKTRLVQVWLSSTRTLPEQTPVERPAGSE